MGKSSPIDLKATIRLTIWDSCWRLWLDRTVWALWTRWSKWSPSWPSWPKRWVRTDLTACQSPHRASPDMSKLFTKSLKRNKSPSLTSIPRPRFRSIYFSRPLIRLAPLAQWMTRGTSIALALCLTWSNGWARSKVFSRRLTRCFDQQVAISIRPTRSLKSLSMTWAKYWTQNAPTQRPKRPRFNLKSKSVSQNKILHWFFRFWSFCTWFYKKTLNPVIPLSYLGKS